MLILITFFYISNLVCWRRRHYVFNLFQYFTSYAKHSSHGIILLGNCRSTKPFFYTTKRTYFHFEVYEGPTAFAARLLINLSCPQEPA